MDSFPHALSSLSFSQLCALALLLAIVVAAMLPNGPDLSHIPTVGSGGLFSYFDGYRYLFRAKDLVQKGYLMYRGGLGAFKVATPSNWTVFLTTLDLINEARLARDDEISILASNLESLRAEYTLGLHEDVSEYHNGVIQSALTRNITTKFDELHDEVVQAFEQLIPANEKEWTVIPAKTTIQVISSRTVNRLLIGAPLCRNTEWVDLSVRFSVDVVIRGVIINAFPRFLFPFVGPLLSPLPKVMLASKKLFEEEIKHRIQMDDEYGKKYDGRPNDLFSWLLDAAPQDERKVENLILRLHIVNMGAVHTVANAFTQALFDLLSYPEYILPLREEIRGEVEKHGWTKAALNQMRGLDSFLKESSRLHALAVANFNRKVVKPSGYTFANGLHLPYGTFFSTPAQAIQCDVANYDNPQTFDGFRFSKMREREGESTKHQLVTTGLDFLTWGHGKHACPGRFLAATQLKTMLAHLLVTYDIKVEEGNEPSRIQFGMHTPPDPNAKVLFKRLED